MVIIIMRSQGVDLQTAVDAVGDMCCRTLDAFGNFRKRLPSWGPKIDEDVGRYVGGLENWIVACLHWGFMSGRYFGAKGPEIKKTGIVELLPSRQTLKPILNSVSSSDLHI